MVIKRDMTAKLLSAIIVMTALVSGILLFSPNIISLNQNVLIMAQTDDSTSSSFTLSNLIKQGSPYIGNLSAPITIVDFSDFQCHLCARHVKNT
ncbi:MAG: thioredoxin domain-containing protein, partial [Nitrososphaeraceae archaeon]